METTLAVACGDGANEQNWVEGMKPDSPDDYTTCKKLLVFFYRPWVPSKVKRSHSLVLIYYINNAFVSFRLYSA